MSDYDNNNGRTTDRSLPGTRSIREYDEKQSSRYPEGARYPQEKRYPEDRVSSQGRDYSQRPSRSDSYSPRPQKPVNMGQYQRPQDGDTDYYINPWDEKQSREGRGSRDSRNAQNAKMAELRRKRKRRKKIRQTILIIVLIVVVLALIMAAAILLKNYLPKGAKGSQKTYTREIDITDAVTGNMAVWLSGIDGKDIDMSWVKDKCGDIKVVSTFVLDKDSNGNDVFSETVDEASYKAMSDQVDSTLNTLLSEIVADRLVMSGYAESVSAEEASNIADQVLGMKMSDYIRENGVAIVPSIAELNEDYTLGSGKYKTSKGVVTFNLADGSHISETLVTKKNSMVLLESGRVYQLEEGK